MLLTLIATLLLPTVDDANQDAAARHGAACSGPLWAQSNDCEERMRWTLLTISNRENPGSWSPGRRWTGIHAGDSHHSPGLKKKGFDKGILSSWCPVHQGDEGFSTVGPHGEMYVYNVEYLGVFLNCVPWWVMAHNDVSAEVAALRYLDLCTDDMFSPNLDQTGRGWCPTINAVLRTKRRYERREAGARARARRARCVATRGTKRCSLG